MMPWFDPISEYLNTPDPNFNRVSGGHNLLKITKFCPSRPEEFDKKKLSKHVMRDLGVDSGTLENK